jgi:HK97 family phage portal protein
MGILSLNLGNPTGFECFRAQTGNTLANPSVELSMALLGARSDAGEFVNSHSAMKVPTLLSGINLLSNDISSLPLYLMIRTKNGPQMAISHPLFRILHDAWSEEITAREGLEHTVRMLITTGNFYNVLNLDSAGNIVSIVPLYAPNVIVRRMTTDEAARLPVGESTLLFEYHDPFTGAHTVYPSDRVWRGQIGSQYGIMGESPLLHGREAIGTALAADKASAKLFKQGAITDAYFSSDIGQDLKPDEWKKLIEAWGDGTKGAYLKKVLPPGVKLNQLSLVNAATTQFIERAKASGLDMCRILNIPASILDANEKGDTYAASESQRRWYVDHTLRPWLVLLQQSINLRCLSTAERNKYYCEFNTDALLDADLQSRIDAAVKLVNAGIISRNEVRKAEGYNAAPGLDTFLVQSNNMGTVNPDGTISPAQKETFSESGTSKPAKQALLDKMVRASAERVVRREQKSKKYDAEFAAETMCISLEAASEYTAKRQSGEIPDENAAKVLAEFALALDQPTTDTVIEDYNEATEV